MNVIGQREEEQQDRKIRPPEVPCNSFRGRSGRGPVWCCGGFVGRLHCNHELAMRRGNGVLMLELSLTTTVDRRCMRKHINSLRVGHPEAILLLVVIPPQPSSFSWVASPLCHFFELQQPIPPQQNGLIFATIAVAQPPRSASPALAVGAGGRGNGAVVAERFRARRMGGNVASGGFYGCRRCD